MRSPKALAPLTPIHNDYAQAWLDYEENGSWWEDVLRVVPLSQIDLVPPWNDARLKDNLEWLKKTGAMPPIRLSLSSPELGGSGRYEIGDGIHRSNAARIMGYDAVPAVVSEKRIIPPPPSEEIEERRSTNMGYRLYQVIKSSYDGPLDWGKVLDAAPGRFVLHIERNEADKEYRWTIEASYAGNALSAKMSGSSSGEAQGRTEDVGRTLAGVMAGNRKISAWVRTNCKRLALASNGGACPVPPATPVH